MTSGLILATLAIVGYSLWVRRDTWWTRWESSATFALLMEGCALVLLSAWAAPSVGSMLQRVLGVWNVQHMLGHLCLIAGISGNIYHMLVRLADPDQVRLFMRRQLMVPVWLALAVMVPAFLLSDQQYHPDFFAAPVADSWMAAYIAVGCTVILYLSAYVSRLMLALRHDPRAKTTIDLYLVSMTFAAAACVAIIVSAWGGASHAGALIWTFLCLSVAIFGYGAARSWQAKSAWFTSGAAL